MTVSDIAELAGVQRSTVSNWQRRHDDFPKPLPDAQAGRPQFDAGQVRAWLTKRYPEAEAGTSRTTELLRTWRYMVNDVKSENPADPLALLVAEATDKPVTIVEDGHDARYPVAIRAEDVDVTLRATKAQAEAIHEFFDAELIDVDRAELIEAAAQEFDDLGRWRRNPGAVAAEGNLHGLLAGLVHKESQSGIDIACGTGALLGTAVRLRPTVAWSGMARTIAESFIAAARTTAEIEPVDILEIDALDGRTFDAVVSIPPFGRVLTAEVRDRLRGLPFGPVRGTADAAWPQLATQALAPGGEAFLVLPHSLASDDRADQMRRGLIQHGLLAAVVTLPPDAHPSLKTVCDLWILSRGREPNAGVLFVDYSAANPTEPEVYKDLTHVLCNWLDDPAEVFETNDPRFVTTEPVTLLGQTVNVDPMYWAARAATPTSAPDLIATVTDAHAHLAHTRDAVAAVPLPDCPLTPDQSVMLTIRDARDDGLLDVVKGLPLSKNRAERSANILGVSDADAMWRGEISSSDLTQQDGRPPVDTHIVRAGDVLVWATPDRQVRSTVCTSTGKVASNAITVLRCSEELNPGYLALILGSLHNAIQVGGSTLPSVRALDLDFPLIPKDQQGNLVRLAEPARCLLQAAQAVAAAAREFLQALGDASGSGIVGLTDDPNA